MLIGTLKLPLSDSAKMNTLPEFPAIGFIGFGELAAALAIRLYEHGADVSAYDTNMVRPGGLDRLRMRAHGLPVSFSPLSELVSRTDILMSCVPPAASHQVVQAIRSFLKPNQILIDATSVKPAQKLANEEAIGAAGALYFDAAVMDAVASAGANALILISGTASSSVASVLARGGLNVRAFGHATGDAAMLKMLRSIWSKGFEALLIEALVTARRAGLEEELWNTINEFARADIAATARGWIISHPRACHRRRDEMEDVVETIETLGLQPIVTTAVQSFFRRSATLGLDCFDGEPDSVVEQLSTRLGGAQS